MPRVANSGKNVGEWYDSTRGEASSTYDVCRFCARKLDADPHCFDQQLVPYGNGEPQGDDGWNNPDVCHPDYDDEDYRCEVCDKRLDGRDNGNAF